ncbi:hypothetical protein AB1E18_018605 [Capra hircus]
MRLHHLLLALFFLVLSAGSGFTQGIINHRSCHRIKGVCAPDSHGQGLSGVCCSPPEKGRGAKCKGKEKRKTLNVRKWVVPADFSHPSLGSHAFHAGPRGGSLIAPDSGPQDPRPPACPPLCTLQSRGPASSENKKGPFKPPTLCLRSVWGTHHPTCARAALGLWPRSAAKSVACARKCVGRPAAPRRLRAEHPGTLSVRSALGPSLRPQTAPGASSSGRSLRGEQDHTEPPRSLRSSLRYVWDVVWKDDAGPRLRTPGSGPGSGSDCRSRPFAAPPRPRRRDARAGEPEKSLSGHLQTRGASWQGPKGQHLAPGASVTGPGTAWTGGDARLQNAGGSSLPLPLSKLREPVTTDPRELSCWASRGCRRVRALLQRQEH